ncbi:MAG: hypothetical protein M3R08_12300 [Bacteroidota bacterium]|nr:hypothetical protein [Bacteroidota bacterium]
MKLRYSFMMLLFMGSLAGMAQESAIYFFQTEEPLDIIGQRNLTEAVIDMDPNAEIFFHFDDPRIFQVNANPTVGETEFRGSIAAKGIDLLAGTPEIPVQQPVNTTPQGKPLYVVTGDQESDRANYQQAVEQWNLNNPADRIEMPVPVGNDQ